MVKKQRIIIKISGASIKDEKNSIFCNKKLICLAEQLKALSKIYSIGVVLGGGNIWRGNMTKNHIFSSDSADYMGMLSTIMNGIALKEVLSKIGVKAELFSALSIKKIALKISPQLLKKKLSEDKLLIFVGGIGQPSYTTDTACVRRAKDINAKIIFMGKDGVSGIYTSDPKINKNAKFINDITFTKAIKMNLKVMDLTAMQMCKKFKINIYVFRADAKNAIINVVKQSSNTKYTYIHN
jgi:uridylate kinase